MIIQPSEARRLVRVLVVHSDHYIVTKRELTLRRTCRALNVMVYAPHSHTTSIVRRSCWTTMDVCCGSMLRRVPRARTVYVYQGTTRHYGGTDEHECFTGYLKHQPRTTLRGKGSTCSVGFKLLYGVSIQASCFEYASV